MQAELVDPDLDALGLAAVVTHANHDGLYLAQRGIAHDGDAVVGIVLVVRREEAVHGGHTNAGLSVALLLERSEDVEVDVHHVLRRPDCLTALCAVGIIVTFLRELQRHFVLIIVALVVRTETNEDAALSVHGFRHVLSQGIRMDIHLQVLVLAHVVVAVLVNGLRLVAAQVSGYHAHGLLVGFDKLCLRRVSDTCDTWRQHVVDRLLVVVLFDADGAHFQGAATACWLVAVVERLLVRAPVALNEVERSKAQDGLFLEARHKDTHEADAREVPDIAFLALILFQRNAEEVPSAFLRVAVAKLYACDALVGNVVASDNHVFRAYAHAILIILLVFVEGIVLIDVFNIGR